MMTNEQENTFILFHRLVREKGRFSGLTAEDVLLLMKADLMADDFIDESPELEFMRGSIVQELGIGDTIFEKETGNDVV